LETTDAAGTAAIDLFGNEFNNTIIGNNGQNTIFGGFGLDVMTGGGNGDVFLWSSIAETAPAGDEADVITDFDRTAGDLISVHEIDADGDPTNGPQDFAFKGFVDFNTGFFDGAGEIGFFTTPTDTFILINTVANPNANGIDFEEATIHLTGAHNVDASWFVL